MIRITLTPDQRDADQALRRDRSLTPHERDWVEMVCLSDAGWAPPKIAQHLGYCTATVRRLLTRFRTNGVAGLRRRPPGPEPNRTRRQEVESALQTLLAQERTWTAAQLVTALADQGITLGPRQRRRYLHGMGPAIVGRSGLLPTSRTPRRSPRPKPRSMRSKKGSRRRPDARVSG